jgi:thiol-disulfide isomerase/thioredoxin
MTRSFAIALLAFTAIVAGWSHAGVEKGKDFIVKGKLTKDDNKDAQRGGPAQLHKIGLKKGTVYTIDMVSTEMDSYLRLLDPKGKQLDEDDDSGGNLNSRIVFNCNADGEYQLVTTTFSADQMGSYTLTVKTSGAAQKPTSAHTTMIGKAAPDLKADFAINAKASKLSDLKGKNVLLYFFDPRSSACMDLLPKLEELSAAHKKNGLNIVGVTFYQYEIGQKLGWDKEEGKIITAKKADRESDQALFKAFAMHHKIDHPLWILTKAEALTAYDSYVVNGVPQVILIDAEGMVRHIDINGKKGAEQVENELKKMLNK